MLHRGWRCLATTSPHPVPSPCSGRSEETAEVIFRDAGDAERALRRYNGVQLDGNSMQVGWAGGSGGLAAACESVWGSSRLLLGTKCLLAHKHTTLG